MVHFTVILVEAAVWCTMIFFSGYYEQIVREIENNVEKSKAFWYNIIWKIALMKLYVMEDVLWQKNALKLIINLYGKC